jgi:hypothetical protein
MSLGASATTPNARHCLAEAQQAAIIAPVQQRNLRAPKELRIAPRNFETVAGMNCSARQAYQ